ncbi:hypothetical protein PGQ11_009244 [Apiospora arundinis]|uniref:Uncharacterized protein n=1 Tax=Apiospora arundinis TaxID=335852 RepID=A0ABR2IHG7_9PEZI
MSLFHKLSRWMHKFRSSNMTNNQDTAFEATHTFTHPYSDPDVLKRYLIGTKHLTERQFRIKPNTRELLLRLEDNNVTLSDEEKAQIIELFKKAEEERKAEAAKNGMKKEK